MRFVASLGIVSRSLLPPQPLGSEERPCESCLTLGAVILLRVPGLVLLPILRTHLLEKMQLPSGRSFIGCVTLSVKSQTSTFRERLLLGPTTGLTPRFLAHPDSRLFSSGHLGDQATKDRHVLLVGYHSTNRADKRVITTHITYVWSPSFFLDLEDVEGIDAQVFARVQSQGFPSIPRFLFVYSSSEFANLKNVNQIRTVFCNKLTVDSYGATLSSSCGDRANAIPFDLVYGLGPTDYQLR